MQRGRIILFSSRTSSALDRIKYMFLQYLRDNNAEQFQQLFIFPSFRILLLPSCITLLHPFLLLPSNLYSRHSLPTTSSLLLPILQKLPTDSTKSQIIHPKMNSLSSTTISTGSAMSASITTAAVTAGTSSNPLVSFFLFHRPALTGRFESCGKSVSCEAG